MIGQTISYYPARKQRDARKRHKILEKLGEGVWPKVAHERALRVAATLRIPPPFGKTKEKHL